MKHFVLAILVLLVFFIVVPDSYGADKPANFELKVSGLLVKKLPQDTRLRFWCPVVAPEKWMSCKLSDLPVTLPADTFLNNIWIVEFVDPKQGQLFSMELSRNLFDSPREIDLKLDAPEPHIRLFFGFISDLTYYAGITKRMRYRDPPVWNATAGKFAKPMVPVMKITRVADGAVIYEKPMKAGCMGFKWVAVIRDSLNVRIKDGTKLQFSVVYDSGGLFKTTTTTFDFTYNAERHSLLQSDQDD